MPDIAPVSPQVARFTIGVEEWLNDADRILKNPDDVRRTRASIVQALDRQNILGIRTPLTDHTIKHNPETKRALEIAALVQRHVVENPQDSVLPSLEGRATPV